MRKYIIYFTVAFAIALTNIISFKYVCKADEYWPDFYGFPFIQSTNTNWVNSFSGELYLLGLIGNILFWFLLLNLFSRLFAKIKLNRFLMIGRVVAGLVMIISIFIIASSLFTIDCHLEWYHHNFKLNYYQNDLECERTFQFMKF